jgi:predicted methyltransferase
MTIKAVAVHMIALALSSAAVADDRGTLIFEDDFERNEFQETTDEIGNGWGSNSKTRAAGNKQVDMKIGDMNMKFYDAKKAKTLSDEQTLFLATTKKKVPVKIAHGEWHTLLVTIHGDAVTVAVDGTEAASFTSAGFAHPTKRMLRLSVPKNAVVDDVRIWSKTPVAK